MLIALYERERSGRGQHVDASCQQAAALATQSALLTDAIGAPASIRAAGGASMGRMSIRFLYPAKDGHVSITHIFGEIGGPSTARLMDWVHEAGFWSVAGPAMTRTLADFGATVVKVESLRRLDAARTFIPFWGNEAGIENSANFDNLNAASTAPRSTSPVPRAERCSTTCSGGRTSSWTRSRPALARRWASTTNGSAP